jgi:TolA-binding protein
VRASVPVAGEVSGKASATQHVVQDPIVRARKQVVEAEAYLELARIFKSMGLSKQAAEKAEEGLGRVDAIIRERSPLPAELNEQAFKIKWELYLAQGDLRSAISTTRLFNRLYPDSPFVDEALMGIAEIRMAEGEYREAVNIYQQVLRLENSRVKAEAQFRIAEATAELGGTNGKQRAIAEYKKCAERFPDSEFAGESLAKLVDYYIETKDYAQADDLLDQIFLDYPDAGFLDAMLLKWVMVAHRMENFPKALEKCRQLIFDYPGSPFAEKAKAVLPQIEARADR